MDEFDEQYLYQTALNNGLKDTTYADTSVVNSALEEAERTNHWEEKQVNQEAHRELETAEKEEGEILHFS